MPTQDERSAATQRLIIAAATREFATAGYEGASVNSIAAAAGISKGALYHHFPDKRSLMVAVYEELERAVVETLVAAVPSGVAPLEAVRLGCHAFLRCCTDPVARRVMLIEAPAALGWLEWRQLDSKYGLGLLRAGVEAAVESGELPDLDIEATSQILLAALMEAALLLGRASAPVAERVRVEAVFDAVLDGLASTSQQS